MKTGKTLVSLAQEIERQQATKKDFVRPTPMIRMDETAALVIPSNPTPGSELMMFGVNDLAHRQLGSYTGIPAQYYDKLRADAPLLLAKNVNHWLENSKSDARMIRTLDGKVRAVLSDKFRPLENADLAEAALPALMELGVTVLSAEITERRLYIKAVDTRIEKDVPTGKHMGDGGHTIFDTLSPVISISNSEVGSGSLSIEVGVYTKACTNLAFFAARSMRKYHVGKKHEMFGDIDPSLFSSETHRLSNAATWAQVRDVVKGGFDRARFEAATTAIADMSEQKLEGDPTKFVDIIGKRFNTTEGERVSILRHLIEGGDLTRYGLFNAVTRTAEDLPDYDRATDFERMGGQIIDLDPSEWKSVNKLAA